MFVGKKVFSTTEIKTVEIEKQAESTSKNVEYDTLVSQLKGISADQVKEYLRIQDADLKLKKADEILGKIMQLLVAQVGYRLSKEDLDQFGKVPERPIDNQPPPAPIEKMESKNDAIVKKDAEQLAMDRRLRARAQAVKSEDVALKFSKQLGNNYAERIQDSKLLTAEQLQDLNGRFEGQIVYDSDQKMNRVVLEFHGQLKKIYIDGKWSARIFNEQGKEISRRSGNGNLAKDISGNENEIFIEVGSKYFQLTYFPQLDAWGGSVLESIRGNYNRVGSIYLKRN
jgi:hypothetical protein